MPRSSLAYNDLYEDLKGVELYGRPVLYTDRSVQYITY